MLSTIYISLSAQNSQHHLFSTMGDHHGLTELPRRRTVTRHQGSSEEFRSKRESRNSEKKKNNALVHGKLKLMPSALKGKMLFQFNMSTPDYGERIIIQHLNTPTTHFIHHPFITFEETG